MTKLPLPQRKCARQCPTESLVPAEIEALARQLGGSWALPEHRRLEKEFRFPDFRQALDFVNGIGALAQAENHHPDIELAWGRVKVTLWTHRAKGLTENDFILAAKIDALPKQPKRG